MLKNLNLNKEEAEKKVNDAVEYFVEKQSYNAAADILSYFSFEEKVKDIAQFYAKAANWEALSSISIKYPEITEKVIIPALKLEADIRINGLLERINDFQTKYQRLQVVQENKRLMPLILGEGGQLLDSDATSDFSEMSSGSKRSTSSRASGASTSSKGSRKSKTPKNLLKRKVKEGSVLEEEWLVGVLNQTKFNDKLKGINLLLLSHCIEENEDFMQYLIAYGLYEQAERILDLMEKYAEISNVKVKNVKQLDYEKEHPELAELYPEISDFKEVERISSSKFDKFKYLKLGREKY